MASLLLHFIEEVYMKKFLACVLMAVLVMGSTHAVYASSNGENAKALAIKGASFFKTNGKDKGGCRDFEP